MARNRPPLGIADLRVWVIADHPSHGSRRAARGSRSKSISAHRDRRERSTPEATRAADVLEKMWSRQLSARAVPLWHHPEPPEREVVNARLHPLEALELACFLM